MFEKILNQKAPIPVTLDRYARNIIDRLLVTDPKLRLGFQTDAKEIKEHPWFSSIDWIAVAEQKNNGLLNPDVALPGDTHNFCRYSDVDVHEDPIENVDLEAIFSNF